MLRKAGTVVACAAAAAGLVWSTPAWAAFHLVMIDQVFFGTADCPNAQYVMMRTQAPGQVILGGRSIVTDNADGSDAGVFGTFTETLSNGDAGVAILMGTPEAEDLFGIPMDELASGHLIFPDGRVCWAELDPPFDCVAYGAFTGDTGTFGSPAAAPQLGMALVRQQSTGNNADDFALAEPAPRNNAGATGTLGQCSGAGPTPTATTGGEPTPTATSPPVSGCPGDCDHSGVVAVNEIIAGVNIALGNATASQCEPLDTNGNQQIEINELIAAVSALLNGCA